MAKSHYNSSERRKLNNGYAYAARHGEYLPQHVTDKRCQLSFSFFPAEHGPNNYTYPILQASPAAALVRLTNSAGAAIRR